MPCCILLLPPPRRVASRRTMTAPPMALTLADLNLDGVRARPSKRCLHTRGPEPTAVHPSQGVAALPENVSAMHDCCVVGPFFVQV